MVCLSVNVYRRKTLNREREQLDLLFHTSAFLCETLRRDRSLKVNNGARVVSSRLIEQQDKTYTVKKRCQFLYKQPLNTLMCCKDKCDTIRHAVYAQTQYDTARLICSLMDSGSDTAAGFSRCGVFVPCDFTSVFQNP